jgi:hypothetical protein
MHRSPRGPAQVIETNRPAISLAARRPSRFVLAAPKHAAYHADFAFGAAINIRVAKAACVSDCDKDVRSFVVHTANRNGGSRRSVSRRIRKNAATIRGA